jgi:hypothetical protein
MFLLKDTLEVVAIDRFKDRFVVHEDAKFILILLEKFETFHKQDNFHPCAHTCHKISLLAVEDIH